MTRRAAIVLSMLMILSPVTATAAVAVPGSAAPPAASTPDVPTHADPGEDSEPGSATGAAASGLSPGIVTDAPTRNASTNDSATRRSGAATTAAGRQASSGQSPYTADISPYQPNISYGGRAVAVDVHPDDSDTAIVASESGGLFETTDGGATWTHLDGAYPHRLEDVEYADPDPSVIVLAAKTDSRNLRIGGRVVSGGGIWVSRDGGGTWTKPASAEPPASSGCNAAGNVTAKSVAFEPGTDNVYVGTRCGLAVSTDLGESWTHEQVAGQNRQVGTVIAPAQDTVDVCTRGTGHFRYQPSSDSWSATSQTLPRRSCHWGSPHSLAASPTDSDVLYAVVPVTSNTFVNDSVNTCDGDSAGYKRELFGSDDGGQSWTDMNAPGCTDNRIPLVATSPTATSNGEFSIYVGKGKNTHWQNCSTGAGSLQCSSSPGDWDQGIGKHIDVDHVDHTDVGFPADSVCPRYLTNDGGVEATSDCGKSWSMVGNSSSASGFNALQLYTIEGRIFSSDSVFGNHTDLYFGTQDNYVWVGSQGGRANRKWIKAAKANEGGWMGLNRTAVSHGDEPIMVEAENGHYELEDLSLTLDDDWPNPPTEDAGDNNGSKAYYVDQGVYLQWNKSRNGDERTLWRTTATGTGSWKPRANLSKVAMRDTVIVGPAVDPAVYVPTGSGVKRVNNVRDSTSPIGSDKPSVTSLDTSADPATHVRGEGTFDWNTVFGAVPDDDPNGPATLLTADENDNVMKISRNGGRSWQKDPELTRIVTDNGRFSMDPPRATTSQASEIDVDPGNNSRIFVGTEANGVIASFDGGQTWGRVPGSRKIPAVSDFFFDDHTGGDGFRDVYVASYGRGLWKIDDVDTLKPVPDADRFDSSGRSNDDPASAAAPGTGWTHTAHLQCPDEVSPILGRESPGGDCSDVLTDPTVRPSDVTSGAPLAAKETWEITLAPLSLDGAGDRDFYEVPDVPNPNTHRDIGALPNAECGQQSVTMGGQNKIVETTGYLSIVVIPKGNSLSRTPVRTAGGATPINIYDSAGQQVDIGSTVSSGNALVHTINCPHENGYDDLTVSFGEGIAANSGGYRIEFRYRIDVDRPNDMANVFQQVEKARRIAENAGKYEQLGERFSCGPSIPEGNPCVYNTRHPIGLGEDGILGGICEAAICRQRWEIRRVLERPFEMTVIGNENLRVELQQADAESDGDDDPDGETEATSERGECIPPERFREIATEGGHGAAMQEQGTRSMVNEMGQACEDGSPRQQTTTTTTAATTATTTTPEGEAPFRHRLEVDSLEPGLYQLVITGPRSAYWLESFTPSASELDESDEASVPRATFDADPIEAFTEDSVTFDASRSIDADGAIESYEWRFGFEEEGRTVTTRAATATHTFRDPGEYPVTLAVTDDDGNTDTVTREVFVSPAPAGDTRVSLDTARRTTGDCPVVYDNRIPTDDGSTEERGGSEADADVEPDEEGFEEGLPCTVYDPATPRVASGEKIRYDVVVENANTGIAAAGFTIELTDETAADITGVTLGSDVRTGREADLDLPADAVEVSAADLTEALGDAGGRTVVATITVEATGGGATELTLSDVGLRNPRGDAYTVTAETGSSLEIAESPDQPEPAPGPTVRLDPTTRAVTIEATTTFDVVVTGVEGGVGSYELVVDTDEAAIARIVGAENRIGGTDRIEPAEDDSSVRVGAFAGDTDDTGNVPVATVTVAGVAPGTAGLAVEADSVSDEAGAQYALDPATDLATVTVREEPPAPEVVAGQPAGDPDGDGVYEDVNGDGDVTAGDATVLFNAVFENNEAVTANPERFDLNSDGDVTPGDANVLFVRAFGG